jgi:hypothetical protein
LANSIRGIGDKLIGQVVVRIFRGGKIDRVDNAKFDCTLFKDGTDGSSRKPDFENFVGLPERAKK